MDGSAALQQARATYSWFMSALIAEQKLQTDYKAGTINPGSRNGFDRLPHLTAVQAYYMRPGALVSRDGCIVL